MCNPAVALYSPESILGHAQERVRFPTIFKYNATVGVETSFVRPVGDSDVRIPERVMLVGH